MLVITFKVSFSPEDFSRHKELSLFLFLPQKKPQVYLYICLYSLLSNWSVLFFPPLFLCHCFSIPVGMRGSPMTRMKMMRLTRGRRIAVRPSIRAPPCVSSHTLWQTPEKSEERQRRTGWASRTFCWVVTGRWRWHNWSRTIWEWLTRRLHNWWRAKS